jgi:prevent-host-death family protein
LKPELSRGISIATTIVVTIRGYTMVTAGIRELKNKTREVLGKAHKEGVVILTNNGKTCAAIVPLKEEDVEDFLAAHNPRIKSAVLKGMKSTSGGGRVYTAEELLEELDKE